jgi:hypothetical protein
MTATQRFTEGSALALARDTDLQFLRLVHDATHVVSEFLFHHRNAHQDVEDTVEDATWAWDHFTETLGVPVPTEADVALFAAEIGLKDGAWHEQRPVRSDNVRSVNDRLVEFFPKLHGAISTAACQLMIGATLSTNPEITDKVADCVTDFLEKDLGFNPTDEELAQYDYDTALNGVIGRAFGSDAA